MLSIPPQFHTLSTSFPIMSLPKIATASLLALLAVNPAWAQLDSWSSQAAKPTAVSHTAGASNSGVFYAVGGTTGASNTTAVESFDTVTSLWTTEAALPTPLSDHGVVRTGGKLWVAGGHTTPAGAALASFFAYDLTAKTWAAAPAMPTARTNPSMANQSGVIYVIGGNSGGVPTGVVEAFTTSSNSWATETAMTTARSGAAAAVIGNLIYVVGGDAGAGAVATVEAYDTSKNTWSAKAPLPAARTEAGAVVLNGMLYIAGGTSSGGTATNTLYVYDPTTNQWLSRASLPSPISGFAFTKANGEFQIAGGTSSGAALATHIAYTPGSIAFVVNLSTASGPNLPAGAVFKTFGNPAINSLGHYAFQATLVVGTGGVTTADASGIWADKTNTRNALVARANNPAPGTVGAVFASFLDPVFDSNDKVSFVAKLKIGVGDATLSTNSTGIWSNAGGTGTGLALIARLSSPAPGTPAGTKFLSFVSVVLPDSGGTVFLAKLIGGSVTTANDIGVWADDGTGTVNLVVRKGDQIRVGGFLKTITALAIFPPAGTVAAQSRGFNPAGDLVYRATFSDSKQAIIHSVTP